MWLRWFLPTLFCTHTANSGFSLCFQEEMAVLCGGPCGGLVLPLAGCDCSSCPLQLVPARSQVSWEVVGSPPPPLTLLITWLLWLNQDHTDTDGSGAGGQRKGKGPSTITVNSVVQGQSIHPLAQLERAMVSGSLGRWFQNIALPTSRESRFFRAGSFDS